MADENIIADTEVSAALKAAPRRRKGKAAAATGKVSKLYQWDDLPEYLRDNEYIYTGYRAETGFRGSLRSLFTLHNESGNVWTHLLGARLLRPEWLASTRAICSSQFT